MSCMSVNKGVILGKVSCNKFVGAHRNILFSEFGFGFYPLVHFFCLWQQVAIYVIPNLLLSFSPVQMVLVLTEELRHLALQF